MPDTAQPHAAAETEAASTEDQLQAAAAAFRSYDPEAVPERARDQRGRFVAADERNESGRERGIPDPRPSPGQASRDEPGSGSGAGYENDEAGDISADEAEAAPVDHEDLEEDAAPAADEAQPELPDSWPASKAELWNALTPDAQAFIRQRDGELKSAVNAKFMEAANLRKAHEAEIGEAQRNRQLYAEAVDLVMSLVVPNEPPISMLDAASVDYDPDAYHYRKAVHDRTIAFLDQHHAQRQQLAAQEQMQAFNAINESTRDGFVSLVPDAAAPDKAPAVFAGLIDYAVREGAPAHLFQTPTTALEWKMIWKAREYDRLQAARAKVRQSPRPEPRKPQPALRPGVAVPKSAIEQSKKQRALERLRSEGSIDAGAAALKHLLKGNLS
jgi:hypothetical protein